MTNATNSALPTLQDTLQFLRTEAPAAAAARIRNIRILRRTETSLTVGKGTPLAVTINRAGKDRFTKDEPTSNDQILLKPFQGRLSTFDILEEHIRESAKDAVLLELQANLNILPQSPATDTPRQQAAISIYNDTEVREEADAAARRALADHPDIQGPTPPAERAHAAFQDFLGRDLIDRVTRLAGADATLRCLMAMQDHLSQFQDHATQHPNLVFLWSRTADAAPESSSHRPPVSHSVSNSLSSLLLMAGKRPYSPMDQGLLEVFQGLNNEALRTAPPVDLQDLITLCQQIQWAGVQPSPEATLHLLRNLHVLRPTTPQRLVSKFIKESQHIPDNPDSQQQLVIQFTLLRRYAEPHFHRRKHPWNPTALREALKPLTDIASPTWQELLQLLPPWSTHATSEQDLEDLRDRLPNPRTNTPTNRGKIARTFRYPLPQQQTLLACARASAVHTIPGRRVALTGPQHPNPHQVVQKLPDGRIDVWTEHGLSNQRPIPQPGHPPTSPEGLAEQAPPHWATTYAALNSFAEANTIRAIQDIAQLNWSAWSPIANQHHPTPHTIASVLRDSLTGIGPPSAPTRGTFRPRSGGGHNSFLISNLATKLLSDVQSLVDPATRALAHRLTTRATAKWKWAPEVTHDQYNIVATLGDALERLSTSNPGAVALGLLLLRPEGPITHPGHFIAMTRAFMEQQGLLPRAWRFAATMDSQAMLHIVTQDHTPVTTMATTLNNLAKAQAVPSGPIAGIIHTRCTNPLQPDSNDAPDTAQAKRDSIYAVTKAICQESAKQLAQDPHDSEQEDLVRQALIILDYVSHTTRLGQTIHSSSWQGLLRRSQDWHEAIQANTHQAALQLAIKRRKDSGTPPKSWHSALPKTDVDGYTVIPLTDEDQLIQESLDMAHCVYTYTPLCLKGCRVFSVLRNNKKVATAQINRESGRWIVTETSGRGNSPPPTGVKKVMKKVANLYNQASANTA